MCNLYSELKGQAAIRAAARAMYDRTGNLPPMPAIFPDMMAPVVRTAEDGERELYGFLTTEPNADVMAVHEKAMPVILTTPEEIDLWMSAPISEALLLQRPLPDGAVRIVRSGVREDR